MHDPMILVDDELSLDDERMTELASDFSETLRQVGESRMRMKARFVLAHWPLDRLSAADTPKARYRLPMQASFLPPTGARFASAHVVLRFDAHSDLDIYAVEPVEKRGEIEVEIEEMSAGEIHAESAVVKTGHSRATKKTYKKVPITIRGIGPGSDTAEWMFDGPPEQGGLPTNVELAIEVAVSGRRLVADVRMTAAVRWEGILGALPFAWPRGAFSRVVAIDLP